MQLPAATVPQSSRLAQVAFDVSLALRSGQQHRRLAVRLLVGLLYRLAAPLANWLGNGHTVMGTVHGRILTLPFEHPLPTILLVSPRYNQPLALLMQAIASEAPAHAELIVIDVGANVGDTIAVIEEHLENVCHYLCIEPDSNLAAILRLNYPDCNRVQILESFIGDEEGALVRLETDARGISSTRLLSGEIAPEPGTQGRLVSLDTAALPFAQSLDRLDLIKIDTEGFDFAVLRSGSQLLRQYRPCLFLEWYPLLLEQLHEEVWRGFEYLNELGYSEFVFFTNSGELHCRVTQPNRLLLTRLASSTYTNGSVPYFDVVASTSAALCDRLVELHSCNSGS